VDNGRRHDTPALQVRRYAGRTHHQAHRRLDRSDFVVSDFCEVLTLVVGERALVLRLFVDLSAAIRT